MQIGTRVRYGTLAMMDLARRGTAVPLRARDIARAHGLSKGYLEGLLATLRRAGLVRALRGPGGGWVLSRGASRIKPLDVYTALEGPTALVPCAEDIRLCPVGRNTAKRTGRSGPTRQHRCRARSLWVAMGRGLEKVLRAGTLASLSGLAPKRKTKKATRKKAEVARKAKRKPKKAPRARIVKRPARKRSKIVKVPWRSRLRLSA